MSQPATVPDPAPGAGSRGRPDPSEAAAYYHRYIDRIASDDVVAVLAEQLPDTLGFLRGVSEEKSLYRYAPDKWSLRQLLSHVNDAERVFEHRAFWFARSLDSPLPSFDQDVGVAAARADDVSWARHVAEFQAVRESTLALFRGLPAEAWMRRGIASGNPFTVRALAYVVAGHLAHHLAVVRERYL
jgi:hypothetical protein